MSRTPQLAMGGTIYAKDQPMVATPAATDTVSGYGGERCAHAGCERDARYHGRCFTHWREAMAEQEQAQTPAAHLPASDAMTEDQQREAIRTSRTRAEAAAKLGLSPKSLMSVNSRCKHLGVPVPGAVKAPPAAPRTVAAAPVALPASLGPEVATPTPPAMLAVRAVEAVAVILRGLPDDSTRHLVANTAMRLTAGDQ